MELVPPKPGLPERSGIYQINRINMVSITASRLISMGTIGASRAILSPSARRSSKKNRISVTYVTHVPMGPEPVAGQLLVRVKAAGVGNWDALVREGKTWAAVLSMTTFCYRNMVPPY